MYSIYQPNDGVVKTKIINCGNFLNDFGENVCEFLDFLNKNSQNHREF